MAYQYDVNNFVGVNGGAEVIFALRQLLVSCGWTVVADADGTTYSGTGVQITHAGSGANGMNNSRAWFHIRGPATMVPRREFCFQRGASGVAYWWIKVSAEDGYDVAGDANDMPTQSAADGDSQNVTMMAAGGTTNGGFIFDGPGSAPNYGEFVYHIGADDAAPFGWYVIAKSCGTYPSNDGGTIVFEPMVPGSYPDEEPDPAIYLSGSTTSMFQYGGGLGPAGTNTNGWYAKNTAGEAWVNLVPHVYYNSGYGQMVPIQAGTNGNTGQVNDFPIAWGRGSGAGTGVGWKGFGSQMRWLACPKEEGEPLIRNGVADRICFGDVTLPWPAGVVVEVG